MKISFEPSTWERNRTLFEQHVASLSSVYDNFTEDYILDGDYYDILLDGSHEGYLATYDEELLTQFHLPRSLWRHAQAVFRAMLEALPVQMAFVPTCDEAMLCICLDFQVKVELQAYAFDHGGVAVRPTEFPRAALRLTDRREWEGINRNTGNFFDEVAHPKVNAPGFVYEIYELSEGGTALGYGLRESGRIFTKHQAIGMYTMPEHRGRGVGRSIILHLGDICAEQGFQGLPGCWYHNHGSKATMESAGYVPAHRLLKVHFSE